MAHRPNEKDVTRITFQTILEGKLTSSGDVVIFGNFSGELSASGEIVIEDGAEINAKVVGGTVRIAGQVEGTMKAEKRLEVTTTGRMFGDIETPVLSVAQGAFVEGQLNMLQKKEAVHFPVLPIAV